MQPTTVKAEVLPTIDFSVSSRAALIWSLPENSAYSVQWAGILCLPPRKNQYYLYLTKQTDEERVKLWVDGRLLIDMWSSIGGVTELNESLVFGKPGGYYDIKVQYSVNATLTTQTNPHGLALQWQAVNEGKSAVPSSLLASAMAMGLPMLRTMPNIPCASTSSISGTGLTLLTAGLQASLTIVSRDEFGNFRLNDQILLAVSRSTSIGVQILTVSGSYNQGIDLSGIHQTRYTKLISGGLFATYYGDRLFQRPLFTKSRLGISECIENMSHYTGVRLGGYLAPTISDTYTFHLTTSSFTNISIYSNAEIPSITLNSPSGSSERILNAGYLSQGSLYRIEVVYWQVTMGSPLLSLQWSTTGGTDTKRREIAKSCLLSRHDLGGSPFFTTVQTSSIW